MVCHQRRISVIPSHFYPHPLPCYLTYWLLRLPSLWSSTKKSLHNLHLVQNSAAHAITRTPSFHHITPIQLYCLEKVVLHLHTFSMTMALCSSLVEVDEYSPVQPSPVVLHSSHDLDCLFCLRLTPCFCPVWMFAFMPLTVRSLGSLELKCQLDLPLLGCLVLLFFRIAPMLLFCLFFSPILGVWSISLHWLHVNF